MVEPASVPARIVHAGRRSRSRRHLLAGAVAGAILAFTGLAVYANRVPYSPVDLTIMQYVQKLDGSWFNVPLHGFNVIGFPPLVGLVYGTLVLLILLSGHRREAVGCAFALLGGMGLNFLTKALVDRPRPPMDLVHVEHSIPNSSFPAGHVLNFSVFMGFLCYLAYTRLPPSWGRNALMAILIASIALMGIARIDSGEHWPSDVLGGYLLAGIWLAVTVEFYRWGLRRARRGSVPHSGEDHEKARVNDIVLSGGSDVRRSRIEEDSGSMPSVLVLILLATAASFVRPVEATADETATPIAAAAAIPATASPADTSDLGPTSAPPWNPPRAMPRRQTWEQVVLVPGRIVSLPLSGIGYVTRIAALHVEDSGLIPMAPRAPQAPPRRMLVLQLPGLGDRTGLGGAAELRIPTAASLPHLSARYAATLLRYNSTLVGASLGPIAVQYGFDWRPQDQFYGVGTSTSEDSLSDFGAQDEWVRGTFRWGTSPDSVHAYPKLRFSAWGGPRSLVTRTGRDSKEVSYETRFPALGSATLDRRVEHLVYGGSLSGDWRSGRPHWGHGGRLMLGVERYDAPVKALALHSSQFDGAQFTRYSVETEGGVSFMRDPRTIRLMVRLTDQTVGSGRDHFLLSDMARLGGRDGLAGFRPGRFHDLDMLHTKLMYVFPLARLFEFEVHSEWGAVYPDIWKDARLKTLKNSCGLSLRARSDAAPRGALGFDVSSEGVRIRYALGGVE